MSLPEREGTQLGGVPLEREHFDDPSESLAGATLPSESARLSGWSNGAAARRSDTGSVDPGPLRSAPLKHNHADASGLLGLVSLTSV